MGEEETKRVTYRGRFSLGLEFRGLHEQDSINFDGSQSVLIDLNAGNTANKQVKTVTKCLSTPQLLTEANLRMLEGVAMACTKEDTESEEISKSKPHVGAFGIKKARDLLACHRMFVNDGDTKGARKTKRGAKIIKEARELITKTRLSPTKPEVVEDFLGKREEHQFKGEVTFIDEVCSIIVGKFRQVPKTTGKDKEGIEKNIKELEENILIKYWDKDYLRTARDEFFAQGCVPLMDTKENDLVATLLERLPGIKTPKPGLAYGLKD